MNNRLNALITKDTLITLRWLIVIAISYLLIFRDSEFELSWQSSLLIPIPILINLGLMLSPKKVFDNAWISRVLFVVDALIITVSSSASSTRHAAGSASWATTSTSAVGTQR